MRPELETRRDGRFVRARRELPDWLVAILIVVVWIAVMSFAAWLEGGY